MVELDGMLSIVMPAYNEEKLIYQSIMKTLDIVSGFVREIELIMTEVRIIPRRRY